jgi:hypothetical protein
MGTVPPPMVDSLHRPSPDPGQTDPPHEGLQSDGMDGPAWLTVAAGLSCGRIHAKEGTRDRVAPQASARSA